LLLDLWRCLSPRSWLQDAYLLKKSFNRHLPHLASKFLACTKRYNPKTRWSKSWSFYRFHLFPSFLGQRVTILWTNFRRHKRTSWKSSSWGGPTLVPSMKHK
jgi:hypothetical protein